MCDWDKIFTKCELSVISYSFCCAWIGMVSWSWFSKKTTATYMWIIKQLTTFELFMTPVPELQVSIAQTDGQTNKEGRKA